jgi:hypothetical protein
MRTRAALAAPMIAQLAVASFEVSTDTGRYAMLAVVALAGWAVIRAPRRRENLLAVLVIGL